jgi:hypothetical protein
MFTLNRYAPKMHPDHNAEPMVQVQGQIPNPLSLEEARHLARQLRSALGDYWPFDHVGKLRPEHIPLPTRATIASIGARLKAA